MERVGKLEWIRVARVVDLPDVRVLACPCAEGFELALGLAHPGAEEVELAESGSPCTRIAVCGVEAVKRV